MPNIETVNSQPWEYYRVSVDELDAHSGYDFLSALPTSLQVVLEAKADDQPI
jgi:endonuclease G